MARIAQFCLAILLIVGIVLMLVIAGKKMGPQSEKQSVPALESSKPRNAVDPFLTAQKGGVVDAPNPVATASRNVGGGLVVSPIEPGTELERIAPLPQPTPPAKADPVKPPEPKVFKRWRLVFNSVVTAAGTFEINGISLVLPGIEVTAANEQCTSPNGIRWPCGAVARTAFRNFVKAKAINCNLPDVPPDRSFVADCLLQGRDPAEWLVEQGWARAKIDGPHVAASEKAKRANRGLFGNPPSGLESVVKPPSVGLQDKP